MYTVTFWIKVDGEDMQVASWEQPSDPHFQVGDVMNFDIHNSILFGHPLYEQSKEEEDLINSFKFKKLEITERGNWVKTWINGKERSNEIDGYYKHRTTVNVEYHLKVVEE